jgi:hypothetical protein
MLPPYLQSTGRTGREKKETFSYKAETAAALLAGSAELRLNLDEKRCGGERFRQKVCPVLLKSRKQAK